MRLVALPLVVVACDDPLALPQKIERTRVLAARVEVVGNADRAWPAPGQAATVRWLVVDPDPSARFSWDLRACVAQNTSVGIPECSHAPFAAVRQDEQTDAQPELAFVMPEQPSSGIVLVHGVVCSGGSPSADAEACLGSGADGDQVMLTIPLGAGENDNPSLEDDIVRWNDMAWHQPDTAQSASCVEEAGSNSLPVVVAGAENRVSIELRGTDRESISTGTDSTRETLQFSYAATAGQFETPYAYVEGADSPGASPSDVPWTAPDNVPQEGLRVRFYVVVRDLRGGSDWMSREVCVVP